MAWETNYEIQPATALRRALRNMLERANDTGQEVRAEFNSRQLTARPGGTIEELDEQWDCQTKAIYDAAELERVTRKHQVACFPELLAACKAALAYDRSVKSASLEQDYQNRKAVRAALDAAIVRAEGPPAPEPEAEGPAF